MPHHWQSKQGPALLEEATKLDNIMCLALLLAQEEYTQEQYTLM